MERLQVPGHPHEGERVGTELEERGVGAHLRRLGAELGSGEFDDRPQDLCDPFVAGGPD